MVKQKQVEGKEQPKDLWEITAPTITMQQFAKETANVEKIIWFGESNSGKTRGYLDILGYYKAQGIPKEKVMMCVVFPDRSTGITKLYNVIPKEYVTRVFPYTVNCYEDMVSATATAEKKLLEHYKQTGMHGWLIVELLEEAWRMSQDYYSRKAFGETLADLMAAKRKSIQEIMDSKDESSKDNAYKALSGWKDWTIIKFYHNFNWIDKIKKMPFNVGATSEVKEETNTDSIFYSIKLRPAGEKDNVHRFDIAIYKSHRENKFYQQCFKWTGMSRLYAELDITDKNSWAVHKKIQKQFEAKGYRSSAIEELEEEAGIEPPKPEVPKEIELPAEKVEPQPVSSTPEVVPPVMKKSEEKIEEGLKEIIKETSTVTVDKELIQETPEEKASREVAEQKEEIIPDAEKDLATAEIKPKEESKKETKAEVKETSKEISKTPEGETEKEVTKEEIVQKKKPEKPKEEPKEEDIWKV